ncbi:20137_t:CDS:2 [Entrophospora sp. SA101]|nr:20137_t:CDS:2 [Entrophospora sp. SA101]CAJ0832135.1 5830_t:CDS:2 [Entrophospora sp. SA101]CAJ0927211.1 14037_t:CDS:2 [Entrophospora sp. SA101]
MSTKEEKTPTTPLNNNKEVANNEITHYSSPLDNYEEENDSAYWTSRSKTILTTTSDGKDDRDPKFKSINSAPSAIASDDFVDDKDGDGVDIEVDNCKFNDTIKIVESNQRGVLYFHKCLELRDKYMKLSLQRLDDNPKYHEDYKIYPPPPVTSCLPAKI